MDEYTAAIALFNRLASKELPRALNAVGAAGEWVESRDEATHIWGVQGLMAALDDQRPEIRTRAVETFRRVRPKITADDVDWMRPTLTARGLTIDPEPRASPVGGVRLRV